MMPSSARRRVVCCAIAVITVSALLTARSTLPTSAAQEATQPNIPTLPETIVEAPEIQRTNVPTRAPAVSVPTSGDVEFSTFGRLEDLFGVAPSASSGVVNRADIETRAILRPAEVLETVPGLIITQHSGSGKANQYFLRGYNLDHGTDFSAMIDDVPMNLRTHAHGQGYLDLNSLIPELVDSIYFRKGPYYADVGDFSSVGSANINLAQRLPESYVKVGGGSYDFWRVLTVDSSRVGQGNLMTVFEYVNYDGPWNVPEGGNKYNGVLKYSLGDDDFGMSISGLAYRNSWTSTDQIPERAVDAGTLDRLGAIDPTDGGRTTRATMNAQWWRASDTSTSKANAYFTYYDLNLFSNFTYFLDDPVNGDQFLQADRRRVSGFNASHTFLRPYTDTTVGVQIRRDNIPVVGLFHTTARERLDTFSDNRVLETSYSGYVMQELRLLDWLRPSYGLRGDIFHFDVDARDPASNSGVDTAGILSPKAALTFGPWVDTELYMNWGMSFHSNDARGVVAAVDPATPLVRTSGEEIGVRSEFIPGWTTTAALWRLDQDSELLFVGDAGTNEPSQPSRRTGVEWTNFFQLTDRLAWDADWAATHSRFSDFDPAGNYIPGAIGNVVTTGPTWRFADRWVWGLRLRYFGSRPLIEDNSVRSNNTSLFNMHVGYAGPRLRASVDFLNLLNSKDQDITYFYTSRLPGEAAGGVDDRHFHPVEPFGARFNMAVTY